MYCMIVTRNITKSGKHISIEVHFVNRNKENQVYVCSRIWFDSKYREKYGHPL